MRHVERFFLFLFGTWRRALITLVVIFVLAITGLLKWFVEITFNNVVLPLFYAVLVIGILWAIIRWLLTGHIRRPGG